MRACACPKHLHYGTYSDYGIDLWSYHPQGELCRGLESRARACLSWTKVHYQRRADDHRLESQRACRWLPSPTAWQMIRSPSVSWISRPIRERRATNAVALCVAFLLLSHSARQPRTSLRRRSQGTHAPRAAPRNAHCARLPIKQASTFKIRRWSARLRAPNPAAPWAGK
jgi:hypothetical protein